MDNQNSILKELAEKSPLDSTELAKKIGIPHNELYADLVSLNSIQYVDFTPIKKMYFELTEEGKVYSLEGTPEAQVFALATPEGIEKEQLQKKFKGNFQVGLGNALKKKIVSLKDGKITKTAEKFADQDQEKLLVIQDRKHETISDKELKQLKKRKLIEQKTDTYFTISKGPHYKQKRAELKTQLTSAMIQNGSWEKQEFKSFKSEAKGLQIPQGNLNLLMKTKQQYMQILIQMGFEEMETDRYVESCFWNFDALFQPQHHPARDAHDTFFVSKPAKATVPDKQYFNRVKQTHEKGGYGSLGYNTKWQQDQATKNILRTHTTAISSQTLKRIVDEKPFKPHKFFSIDRVFRNETVDNSHLAEFHQVEGFIIDRNLGLNHLIGTLSEFYHKIGITDLSFKPTYNPYTEPSMEVYGVNPITKKKMEIGNSGIFRPEMLKPMGFPDDVSVIAWGLGLERPTMIQERIKNIKELMGPGVSIRKVKESQIQCL